MIGDTFYDPNEKMGFRGSLLACYFGKILDQYKKLPYCDEIWHGVSLTQIKIIGETGFFIQTQ